MIVSAATAAFPVGTPSSTVGFRAENLTLEPVEPSWSPLGSPSAALSAFRRIMNRMVPV
jgi:hypothetical protein